MNSDRIMCRIAILDMADRILTGLHYLEPARRIVADEYVTKLRDEILDRVSSGRSMDCDAYRALHDLDSTHKAKTLPLATSAVDIAWIDDGDGPQKL